MCVGVRVIEVLYISQHICAECCGLQRAIDPALRGPTVSLEEMAINLAIVQMCNYKLWYLVKKNRESLRVQSRCIWPDLRIREGFLGEVTITLRFILKEKQKHC